MEMNPLHLQDFRRALNILAMGMLDGARPPVLARGERVDALRQTFATLQTGLDRTGAVRAVADWEPDRDEVVPAAEPMAQAVAEALETPLVAAPEEPLPASPPTESSPADAPFEEFSVQPEDLPMAPVVPATPDPVAPASAPVALAQSLRSPVRGFFATLPWTQASPEVAALAAMAGQPAPAADAAAMGNWLVRPAQRFFRELHWQRGGQPAVGQRISIGSGAQAGWGGAPEQAGAMNPILAATTSALRAADAEQADAPPALQSSLGFFRQLPWGGGQRADAGSASAAQ